MGCILQVADNAYVVSNVHRSNFVSDNIFIKLQAVLNAYRVLHQAHRLGKKGVKQQDVAEFLGVDSDGWQRGSIAHLTGFLKILLDDGNSGTRGFGEVDVLQYASATSPSQPEPPLLALVRAGCEDTTNPLFTNSQLRNLIHGPTVHMRLSFGVTKAVRL